MTAAMRSGDAFRRDVLRMAQSAVYLVEKTNRRELADDEIVGVLAREVKMRRESVEAFRRGGREDLASKEEREIAVLSGYLPQQLGDEEIRALVGEAIAATGAATPRDMGKVMGWLAPKTKGRADGKRVSELVSQGLAARTGARAGTDADPAPNSGATADPAATADTDPDPAESPGP